MDINMSKFKRQNLHSDAILTSDWHLREHTPQCRIDDYWSIQENKVDFIFDLARKNQCPIFLAGDMGHKPRWSCRLLEWFISKAVDENINIFAIPGQHDLVNHRLDLWEQSGIGVLQAAEAINLCGFDKFPIIIEFDNFCLNAFPYGVGIQHIKPNISKPQIAITHEMIIKDRKLWPGQKAPKGNSILKKYTEFSIVHSGDNHNPFVAEYEERKLVNPGSLMRMTADQENHRPRVYLWYAKSNEVVPVYLPIEQGVITREHIEAAEDRSNRYDSFMARVREDVEIQLSYKDNVGRYFERFSTELPVKEKVQGAMV